MNLIFVALVSTFFSAAAWQIDKIEGEVTVKREGKATPAVQGMELQVGDLIHTGKKAKARLKEGNSQLWIGQRTFFKIKAGLEGAPTQLKLDKGKYRVKVDKPVAEKYIFRLKSATAGVRGTEFFAESNNNLDRLCILEGKVEATSDSGDRIIIPAGQGVAFREGITPRLVANSSFLVDRWVAETSFESTASGIDTFYAVDEPQRHSFSDSQSGQPSVTGMIGQAESSKWFYGARSFVTVSDVYNTDFNNQINDPDTFSQWWYFSPFIQYGKKEFILVRPSINYTHSRVAKPFDKRPLFTGDEQTTLSFAEAYFQANHDSFQFTGGAKQITWHDGILISDRAWSSEPMNYTMLRGIVDFDNWQLELLGVVGENPTYPLDGFNQVDFIGANITLPDVWGQAYILYANLPNQENVQTANRIFYNREMWNLGYFNNYKYGWLDYKLSAILQNHVRFPTLVADRGLGYFVDFELGANLTTSQPWRLSLRHLYASRDFGGIQYEYYVLGRSFYLKEVSNIRQLRVKLEYQFVEKNLLALEYIHSWQVANDGLFQQSPTTTTENNYFLTGELNLNYSIQILDSLKAHGSLFWVFPTRGIGADSLNGFLARLEWDY